MVAKRQQLKTRVATPTPKIDPNRLRRAKPEIDLDDVILPPANVSAGPVDKVIELAFNPTREKIREVTIIDRMQGRMFPQLDMVNMMRRYCMEIAVFRQDSDEYQHLYKRKRPLSPDPIDELLFRTAQWQKSVGGKNLERATDIALAETEVRAGEEEVGGGADAWKE